MWKVSKWQFDPRIIIIRGKKNVLSSKSFGSTVTLYPFTQRYVRSAKRGHIFLLHQFWKCVQLPYSLQQGLINMNSTMIIMSLPIISSQLYYIQFYVFCAMLIAYRSQLRRNLALYK